MPMSRPSSTIPPPSIASRCSWTSRARTAGTADTVDTAAVTSGLRMGPETSIPSASIVGASGSVPETRTTVAAAAATAAGSSTSTPRWSSHHVTARYIAPVSR